MENYSSVTKVGIPPNYNCRNEERNRLYALIREFSSILYSGDKIIINGRDGEINRDNRNIQISENYYPDQQRGGRGFYRERGLPPKKNKKPTKPKTEVEYEKNIGILEKYISINTAHTDSVFKSYFIFF